MQVKSLLDHAALRRPMTLDETKVLAQLTLAELSLKQRVRYNLDPTYEMMREEAGSLFLILTDRLQTDSPETAVTTATLIWTIYLSDSPGKIVMWAYTLHRMYEKTKRLIDLHEWAKSFPMGIPTEEGYLAAWRGQKGYTLNKPVDNALDHKEYWT